QHARTPGLAVRQHGAHIGLLRIPSRRSQATQGDRELRFAHKVLARRHRLIKLSYDRDLRESAMQDRIRDVLAAAGRIEVDPREVDDQGGLYELGVSSDASVDVMLALEDVLDIEFPEEVLKNYTFASVRNIVQVIERMVASSV